MITDLAGGLLNRCLPKLSYGISYAEAECGRARTTLFPYKSRSVGPDRLGAMLNCGHSLGKVRRDAGPMDLASFRWVEREDEPVVRWFGTRKSDGS